MEALGRGVKPGTRAVFAKINYPEDVVLLPVRSTDGMIPENGNQFSDPIMPMSRRMAPLKRRERNAVSADDLPERSRVRENGRRHRQEDA
jgi:hypothetical protein